MNADNSANCCRIRVVLLHAPRQLGRRLWFRCKEGMQFLHKISALLLFACATCHGYSEIALTGVMSTETGYVFLLSSEGRNSEWLSVGAAYSDYKLIEYRYDIEVLKLRSESRTVFLKLGSIKKAPIDGAVAQKEISHVRVISIERNGFRSWGKNAAGQRYHRSSDIVSVVVDGKSDEGISPLQFIVGNTDFLELKVGRTFDVLTPLAVLKGSSVGLLPLNGFIVYSSLNSEK